MAVKVKLFYFPGCSECASGIVGYSRPSNRPLPTTMFFAVRRNTPFPVLPRHLPVKSAYGLVETSHPASSCHNRSHSSCSLMIVLAKCIARCFLFGGESAPAGCAPYERLSLNKESRLVARASELEGAGGKRITLAALDRLVVLNNPDLRAARAKLGVGAAQVLQAGILPNPVAFFITGPGITQDVKSILLLRTKSEAAQNAASEISPTLLWQEWQTIGKAGLLPSTPSRASGRKSLSSRPASSCRSGSTSRPRRSARAMRPWRRSRPILPRPALFRRPMTISSGCS
jgi:hypothetical protein